MFKLKELAKKAFPKKTKFLCGLMGLRTQEICLFCEVRKVAEDTESQWGRENRKRLRDGDE